MDQSLRSLSSAAVAVGVTGVLSISVPLLLIFGPGGSHSSHSSPAPVVTTAVQAP